MKTIGFFFMALLVLLSCEAGSAESLDFSNYQVGNTFARGDSFPDSKGPFQYCGSKEGEPAGSSSSAKIVAQESGKALQLATTPKEENAPGRPFAWIKSKEAVDTAGEKITWSVQFSINQLGNGNGLNIALLTGVGSRSFSMPLSMIQPVNGKINASPAWVLGLTFSNNKGKLQAMIRRLVVDKKGNASLSSYDNRASEWNLGAGRNHALQLIPEALYTLTLSFDGDSGKLSFALADEKGKIANAGFQRNELWKNLDLSSLRLAAGDILSNSGSEWELELYKIEWIQ